MNTGPNLALVFVDDMETATGFYERIFGWDRSGIGFAGGVHYALDPIPVVIVPTGVFRTGDVESPRGWGLTLCIQVRNLEATYQRVCFEGAKIILEPEDQGFGPNFTFLDPSGNHVTVYAVE